MEAPQPTCLTYRQARSLMQRVRAAEVPVEHAVSLPIPTLRLQTPAFIHFASPAFRDPEGPVWQSPPDRWWAIDATRGRLLIYSLVKVHSFTQQSFARVELHSNVQTVDDLRQLHSELDAAIDSVLADFFAAVPGDSAILARVLELLNRAIPAELMPIYRELATDFFRWLA